MIPANVWIPDGDDDGVLAAGLLEVERTDTNEIRVAFRPHGSDNEHTAYVSLFDAGRLAGELEAAADGGEPS